MQTEPQAPSPFNLVCEAFSAVDMIGVPAALLNASRMPTSETKRAPVMVLPGLGAGDASTAPLRYYLRKHGYDAAGWGLGTNLGGRGMVKDFDTLAERWDIDTSRPHRGEAEVPALCEAVIAAVEARAGKAGAPIALVGWSLGGYLAREVARDLPDLVSTVVTMGSPVVGGPKYTSVAPLYRARGVDVDWIAEEIDKRYERPITQPITAIYSRQDGVVGWQASIDHRSPNVDHIEVAVSHMGLGLNARVWDLVLGALKKHT